MAIIPRKFHRRYKGSMFHVSQHDVARCLKITQPRVSQLSFGIGRVSWPLAKRMAHHTGIPVELIMDASPAKIRKIFKIVGKKIEQAENEERQRRLEQLKETVPDF